MSELAFNMNGEPFEIPPTATGWRVRRMKTKGAPEVVYSREGTPLVLPLEAGVEELRNAVGTPGRYRVDPVEDYRPIPNAPAGYVFLHGEDTAPGATASTSVALARTENMTLEAMRMAMGMANTIVERFAQVMDSSATILRAADGAGLPARPPRADAEPEATDEDDEEDDDAPAPSPAMAIVNALVQFAPVIVTAFKGKEMPKLDAMLDWRKAAPKPAPELAEPATTSEPEAEPELPALDTATMAKIAAIQGALTPAEAARALKLAGELTPAERHAYFAQLSGLSVTDAVAKVRSLIGTPGGVS